MPEPAPPLADRVERLERLLAELRLRVEAMELQLSVRTDAKSNRAAVREKIVFDWQS